MRGSTHAAIGANTVWIPILLGATIEPWLFVVGAFVALLPDLDASESKIKNLKMGGYIGGMKVFIKPFAPIAMVISSIFRHRGALHSFLFLVIVAVGANLLVPQDLPGLWWIILLGYASHLVADGLTKSGIEFFWPMRIRVGLLPKGLRVKTGGIIDTLLLIFATGGVILFLYSVNGFTMGNYIKL